jgi:esterase/lipase superfamily enzyme
VKAVLVGQGIEANRVYTEGKGSKQPAADNAAPEGRAKNRRVELDAGNAATRVTLDRVMVQAGGAGIGAGMGAGVGGAGAGDGKGAGGGGDTRGGEGVAPSKPPKGQVPVLFGTNRAKTGLNDPAEYFGSQEAAGDAATRLTLGRVVVRVPPNRLRGELKEPGYFALTLERVSISPVASLVGVKPRRAVNPDTDFSFVGAVDEFNGADFADALKASVARSKSRATLVYVHGFANSFKDAAFRTAQFAYDLTDADYDVVPVLFTWPSDPSKGNYMGATDRTWSAGQQLATFLDKLTLTTGNGVVHIVAHSKGAQVLGFALQTLRANNLEAIGQDGKKLVPRFNQIILAAPDIRVADFSGLLLPAVSTHHSVTNYVSSNDAALKFAAGGNESDRAGDSANTAIVIKGIETIDVTAVNYRPGGHSSFADSARVIADIRQLLSGKTPEARGLARVVRPYGSYWLLKE